MSVGAFVVIEGIDGAGTTTQCERYAAHLRAKGRRVHVTREPSDGPIGRLIRSILRREIAPDSRESREMMALLFAADRLDHNLSEIDKELANGAIVLSDRYALSSLAYQSAARDGVLPTEELILWIRSLNRFARTPDVTLVVDVTAEHARSRRSQRGGAEELYEAAALQARLAEIYLEAHTLLPDERVLHIDGSGSIDEVASAMRDALDPVLEVAR